jgi:hypothetical protein
MDRWRINRLLKKTGRLPPLSIRNYKDPEDAKTWLVNERG